MMIFVVGPSRGGKTTLLSQVLPQFPGLALLDLDAEDNKNVALLRTSNADLGGWEGRWHRDEIRLGGAEEKYQSACVVVDVGAGSLQTRPGRSYFAERGLHVVTVSAPEVVVLGRHAGRDPEEFSLTEYSEERQKVYRAARFQVDSSCEIQESVVAFERALRELIVEAV